MSQNYLSLWGAKYFGGVYISDISVPKIPIFWVPPNIGLYFLFIVRTIFFEITRDLVWTILRIATKYYQLNAAFIFLKRMANPSQKAILLKTRLNNFTAMDTREIATIGGF